MTDGDFFTFSEYMKKEYDVLTASMEDYLEMTYRLAHKEGFTRIHELAGALNVQPPSATKMIQKLAELNFIKYEKYGMITLTEQGKNMGQYLLNRHNIVESFLKVIGITKNVLEQTEKVEHTIDNQTVLHLKDFIEFVHTRPDVIRDFIIFKDKKSIINKNSK
ncbi:metal-dependent transcriptional regulator [Clostridium luticellarii]|jgi:Mn-dependent DtxR family transcriptional regulator|uniref:Manganese transport regulator n=1 Tax=Clostridium luticellarii TaxID=1691940 RepID=A0A2T0BLM7_9CLOT|nr:iron dependent repressor, metal binding and dimerization domain protein [Clostridium luticellarii]MCI1944360.1 Fur family transcriptional regulator [Clostridium luticellarii]MCI1967480.1 Fur family transcriptional regulator [Clostridium luticellarii]MCI1994992.1 Fur family transcriptional regulator [Clostridium luticellarii]MCI2039569.1 Fur family transcriptional regulator [Clostridium luticellarii]PRR84682.1 Transcriptional regulator MntR [Clostridium luticellarii]